LSVNRSVFFFSFHQTDPGVPIVYAGFGALMLTTCISYLSHSQVCVIVFHCSYWWQNCNWFADANLWFGFFCTRYGHCKMEVQ